MYDEIALKVIKATTKKVRQAKKILHHNYFNHHQTTDFQIFEQKNKFHHGRCMRTVATFHTPDARRGVM